MVDPDHPGLSIVCQCSLLSMSRSSFYYEATGENPFNLLLMRLIDEQFLQTRISWVSDPFEGKTEIDQFCHGPTGILSGNISVSGTVFYIQVFTCGF